MNKFTLVFKDQPLENTYFQWSYFRDYTILKYYLGLLGLLVQFPSIVISFSKLQYFLALSWVVLLVITLASLILIKLIPKTYNMLLASYHLLIMLINVYYLEISDQNPQEQFGKNILFIFAVAHGTSHNIILMLGTNFILNTIGMLTAYIVYIFVFLEKGFSTFHLFLLFIAIFSIFSKYEKEKSQREMFLLREREKKWVNIMKKALPSSIILVNYDEKMDQINLELANMAAQNIFKVIDTEGWSIFSKKIYLEPPSNNNNMNPNLQKVKNQFNTNSSQIIAKQSLIQYIDKKFKEFIREKNTSNLTKKLTNQLSQFNNQQQAPIQQQCLQQQQQDLQQQRQEQNNQIIQSSIQFYKKGKLQQKKNDKATYDQDIKNITNMNNNNNTILQKTSQFIITDSQQLKKSQKQDLNMDVFQGSIMDEKTNKNVKYKVKIINYYIGQYFCLIVIEEESDEEEKIFFKQVSISNEYIINNLISNLKQSISKIVTQLQSQEIHQFMLQKLPLNLAIFNYESAIVFNTLFNIRSHFLWPKTSIQPEIQTYKLDRLLNEIYCVMQGNQKLYNQQIKFYITKGKLDDSFQNKNFDITSDIGLIKQLLLNFLRNSLTWTDKGYIIMKIIFLEGKNSFSNIFKFVICDSGQGFENNLEKIQQLLTINNPMKNNQYYNSMCFGLKNAQQIIKCLGPVSNIFINTKNNKGSRIWFYLYQDLNILDKSQYKVQFKNKLFYNDLELEKNIDYLSSFQGIEDASDNYFEEKYKTQVQTLDNYSFQAQIIDQKIAQNIGKFEI